MRKQRATALFLLLVVMAACQSSADEGLAGEELTLDELYASYTVMRGDLHLHSSTASFDSAACGPDCQTFTAAEQLAAAQQAGLDFAALTEHDRNPNEPNSRMTKAQWNAALEAVANANSPGFVVLAGYEWTSSHRPCFDTEPQEPDFSHKLVILPPDASERCDSDVCVTPQELGEFANKAGGIILTPHPWRIRLLQSERPDLPAFVTRSYFDYEGDGPGGVFVGAEVGPDFPPLRWKVLCAYPDEELHSQTGTLAEWMQALKDGKRLGAVASSDRHFGFTPFGSRSTVLFVTAKTPEAILEALKARRSIAANLAPFEVHLAIGNTIVGETAGRGEEGRLRVTASPDEIAAIEIWSGDQLLESFPPEAANQRLTFAPVGSRQGPIWAKVTGVERDTTTGTPRTTITSPIWLE